MFRWCAHAFNFLLKLAICVHLDLDVIIIFSKAIWLCCVACDQAPNPILGGCLVLGASIVSAIDSLYTEYLFAHYFIPPTKLRTISLLNSCGIMRFLCTAPAFSLIVSFFFFIVLLNRQVCFQSNWLILHILTFLQVGWLMRAGWSVLHWPLTGCFQLHPRRV